MFISMVLEKKARYLASEQKRLFWSIDSAGPQARLLILKNASQINRKLSRWKVLIFEKEQSFDILKKYILLSIH
jgi:hypothetical protein